MIYRFEWSPHGPSRLQVLSVDGEILTDLPRVVTLREAAKILKKSRRHLYRFIQRGWINPVAKFSGEFFLDPAELDRLSSGHPGRHTSLPSRLAPHFPDYDLKSLNLRRDADLVLTRLLERGTSSDIRWLKRHLSPKQIRDFLLNQGEKRLSSRALRFWSLIWNIKEVRPKATWSEMGRQTGGVA